MAVNKNINEAGWFYHAPGKRRELEDPVSYPAMSQIPGLGDDGLTSEGEPPPRSLFKESDTKYVRLAKQGGRANLLHIKENVRNPEREAVPYPRNTWYYLEDNALEEAQNKEEKEPWKFMLPEYMVHESYKPSEEDQKFEQQRKRAPYAYDQLSAYEREGNGITDKTVKLPEVRRVGYGVRSGRPLKVKAQPAPERSKPPSANAKLDSNRQHMKYLPMPSNDKERPEMSKLMAYAYDKEWHEQVQDWQKKQDKVREKITTMATEPKEKMPGKTEYGSTYGNKSAPHAKTRQKSDSKQHHVNVKTNESQKMRENLLKKPEEKEMFKLTRFKNVAARVESHRPGKGIADHQMQNSEIPAAS
ncbi:hypothetical protein ACJMK2_013738 [Sinanodonta woodiana]|uniref:Uncharacterized protein n=1 Tax=Sinanodonta woodiana TaxID=1069815 RepID=A0ABD3V1Q7_SINWO